MIILHEAESIFGLTSILDSFSINRPMIVTKTSKMSMDIEKNGFGLEVAVGSVIELEKAINKLLTNQLFYDDCVANMRRYGAKNIIVGYLLRNYAMN